MERGVLVFILEVGEPDQRIRIANDALRHLAHRLLGAWCVDAAAEARVIQNGVKGLARATLDFHGLLEFFLDRRYIMICAMRRAAVWDLPA